MTAKLIKGTEIREEILKEIADEVKEIKEKYDAVPGLVTILVGENPGSKLKKANSLGVKTITYDELIRIIDDHQRIHRLF